MSEEIKVYLTKRVRQLILDHDRETVFEMLKSSNDGSTRELRELIKEVLE